ncbi:MAG TPA: thioredoxin domain-containing protein [Anaerolineales bacterium]
MTNHLAGENSPYLLQHSENPVEWYPWGEEALDKARREDKPIFLSIGYAACHWCHVMERESFEDPDTAAVLNEHFISIKVDREARPDLDAIYMQATTSMTGSGGWPMSVFLTTDLHPFYAGTYFPPVRRYNMPAFPDLLRALAREWENNRAEILSVGKRVVDSLRQRGAASEGEPNLASTLEQAEAVLTKGADAVNGGWGGAPKFPQPQAIEFLLRRAASGRTKDPHALEVALQTLRAMGRGGIYDVVGGGFCRYSTDDRWLVPHFEKMLYDNAQLALAYLHASLMTGDTFFASVATETLDFLSREMMHPDGGFYSSIDADSEGVEGKYYAWTDVEIREALADDQSFELMSAAYAITSRGNWEGRTVLQRALDDATLAARFDTTPEEITKRLRDLHARLRKIRDQRVRPATDDKVIAAWNGMALQAFAQAARLVDDEDTRNVYAKVATRNADFLLRALRTGGQLRRIWRNGRVGKEVFLEDYASLILGLLELYQTTFENRWFVAAQELAVEMVQRFSDPAGGFFDTPAESEELLVRPKDIQDGATPSGNALACEALLRLGSLTGNGEYRDVVEKALRLGLAHAAAYPLSFGRWISVADLAEAGDRQLALLHPRAADLGPFLRLVNSTYRPNLVVAASEYPPPADAPSVLRERPLINGATTAYLCSGFVCEQPTASPQELQSQLDSGTAPKD